MATPAAHLNSLVCKQNHSNQNLPMLFPYLSASEWKVSEVFSHFHKFVVRKYYIFHQKVDGIDQNMCRENLSETSPRACNLIQALTNNNLLLPGTRSMWSTIQWKFLCLISHNHQEFHPMHTAIPKWNLKHCRDRICLLLAVMPALLQNVW